MTRPPWGDRKPDVMASASQKHRSGITYRAGDINDARAFEWAWKDRLLLGYLNLLVGEEGVGKGNLASWFLARVTRGELPGSLFGKPRNVAVIGDEDSWSNIWGPRLHAAGADLSRTLHIESVEDGVLDVSEDSDALAAFIAAKKIAVVYFDQLLDNLGYADNWKDKQVRNALAPLRHAVRETNVAGVLTLHPNKRGGSFRDRVSGTPAFNALSRSSLLVARHPREPERKVAVRAKGNYAVEPPAFEFVIEGVELKVGGAKRRTLTTSAIADVRETSLRADEVLDAKPDRRREGSKADVARRSLAQLLSDGEPHPAGRLQRKLKQLHNLDPRAVTRASTELGVRKWQNGFQGRRPVHRTGELAPIGVTSLTASPTGFARISITPVRLVRLVQQVRTESASLVADSSMNSRLHSSSAGGWRGSVEPLPRVLTLVQFRSRHASLRRHRSPIRPLERVQNVVHATIRDEIAQTTRQPNPAALGAPHPGGSEQSSTRFQEPPSSTRCTAQQSGTTVDESLERP